MKTDPSIDPMYPSLKRHLGLFGATMMGLGAMMGTGVFVSIGVAAGVSGPSVILAIAVAAFVAVCNALSSAQLAAVHPVSGGTYEYGYRYLSPSLGFSAGWMFLCAKSASAATAALGFSGYFTHLLSLDVLPGTVLAASLSVATTCLVLNGLKRSNLANTIIVGTTLFSLVLFILTALPSAYASSARNLVPLVPSDGASLAGFLQACALMFVAFTGYGRIATMGEEVSEPNRNIPRAILWAMSVAAVIYIMVGLVAVGSFGAAPLGEVTRQTAAPLESILRSLDHPFIASIVAIGAATAMLGVLLNLILGLSRVVLAMGRRGDLPGLFSRLSEIHRTPSAAIIGIGFLVTALTLVGSVKLTWSFSAFTVLIYYAITNLAALRLPEENRLYPRVFAWAGLLSCLFLAFWVEPSVWLVGLATLGAGLLWHTATQIYRRPRRQ